MRQLGREKEREREREGGRGGVREREVGEGEGGDRRRVGVESPSSKLCQCDSVRSGACQTITMG